jgi:hypothetical protein
VPTKRRELEGEDSGNWVTYFDGAQSREGLGADILMFSLTG